MTTARNTVAFGDCDDAIQVMSKASHVALLTIRSTDEIGRLLEQVIRALADAGFSRKDQFGVRLALEEAIVNAVKHGNNGDPRKAVRIWWMVGPASMKAVVQDEGMGFDPEKVPDARKG